MGCLAQVFENEEALDKLEGFTSLHGPAFYKLPVNEDKVTLTRFDKPVDFGKTIPSAEGEVTIFDPLMDVYWDIAR